MDEPVLAAVAASGLLHEHSTRPGAVPVPTTRRPIDDAAEVVSLGLWVEFRREGPASVDLDVSEFAVLADGRCLTLHAERGGGWSGGTGPWDHDTVETVSEIALAFVLPDDDEIAAVDEHCWSWLVDRLAVHGVAATEEQLRTLPYEVELSPTILSRLPPAESR
jgi:hypothetical protein